MSAARFYSLAAIVTVALAGTPAVAGVPQVPGPIAGVGVGALAIVAIGYRALKQRIGR